MEKTRLTCNHDDLSKKPERNDQRDDVFPADVGQDSAARTRRVVRGLSQEPRRGEGSRRRVLQFSARALSRSSRARAPGWDGRRNSGVVFRERAATERGRYHDLEFLQLEARLERFRDTDARRAKTKARNCESH